MIDVSKKKRIVLKLGTSTLTHKTGKLNIRRMTNLSLSDIGKEFGDRDHTTVLHSLDKVEKQMRTDPAFAEVVKEITTNINSKK